MNKNKYVNSSTRLKGAFQLESKQLGLQELTAEIAHHVHEVIGSYVEDCAVHQLAESHRGSYNNSSNVPFKTLNLHFNSFSFVKPCGPKCPLVAFICLSPICFSALYLANNILNSKPVSFASVLCLMPPKMMIAFAFSCWISSDEIEDQPSTPI